MLNTSIHILTHDEDPIITRINSLSIILIIILIIIIIILLNKICRYQCQYSNNLVHNEI